MDTEMEKRKICHGGKKEKKVSQNQRRGKKIQV